MRRMRFAPSNIRVPTGVICKGLSGSRTVQLFLENWASSQKTIHVNLGKMTPGKTCISLHDLAKVDKYQFIAWIDAFGVASMNHQRLGDPDTTPLDEAEYEIPERIAPMARRLSILPSRAKFRVGNR